MGGCPRFGIMLVWLLRCGLRWRLRVGGRWLLRGRGGRWRVGFCGCVMRRLGLVWRWLCLSRRRLWGWLRMRRGLRLGVLRLSVRIVLIRRVGAGDAASRELDEVEDDVEAARRLLVNVDQSFSRSRQSWSPPSLLADRRGRWQPGTWENLPPKLLAAARRLQGVGLECGDGVEMIARWDQRDTLIYVDPPYMGEHRLTMSKGYRVDGNAELWPRLVDALATVKRAAVVLSGYPNVDVDRLGWRTIPLRHNRTVQARAGGTLAAAPESVWLSPNVAEPLPQLFTEAVA